MKLAKLIFTWRAIIAPGEPEHAEEERADDHEGRASGRAGEARPRPRLRRRPPRSRAPRPSGPSRGCRSRARGTRRRAPASRRASARVPAAARSCRTNSVRGGPSQSRWLGRGYTRTSRPRFPSRSRRPVVNVSGRSAAVTGCSGSVAEESIDEIALLGRQRRADLGGQIVADVLGERRPCAPDRGGTTSSSVRTLATMSSSGAVFRASSIARLTALA